MFLVEDEALIGMMLADMLEELGHRVAAEASNIQEAQVLAGTAIFDLAILDINVAGSIITPVAEIIDRRGPRCSLSPAMDQAVDRKPSEIDRHCRNCYRFGNWAIPSTRS